MRGSPMSRGDAPVRFEACREVAAACRLTSPAPAHPPKVEAHGEQAAGARRNYSDGPSTTAVESSVNIGPMAATTRTRAAALRGVLRAGAAAVWGYGRASSAAVWSYARASSAAVWGVVRATSRGVLADNVFRLAASLSFYTIFASAPILVIVVAVAGAAFGEDAARGRIVEQARVVVGNEGAVVIQDLLRAAYKPGTSLVATLLGLLTLLVGATGAFAELQDALNTIWGVVARPRNAVAGLIKVRLLSFLMVLVMGFLLLTSLVLGAGLEAMATFVAGPLRPEAAVLAELHTALSYGVFAVLFAVIFYVLPDVQVAWSDVVPGAALSALLFWAGKWWIGIYLAHSSFTSMYGAAASVVVVLLWVFYSSLVILIGAEFTKAWATRFGRGIRPDKYAVRVSDVVEVHFRRMRPADRPRVALLTREARRQVEDVVRAVDRTEDLTGPQPDSEQDLTTGRERDRADRSSRP